MRHRRGVAGLGGATAAAGIEGDLLGDASMQNCGPKTGRLRVTAATCRIQNATLLDDDPDPAPSLECAVEGEATDLGTCSQRR